MADGLERGQVVPLRPENAEITADTAAAMAPKSPEDLAEEAEEFSEEMWELDGEAVRLMRLAEDLRDNIFAEGGPLPARPGESQRWPEEYWRFWELAEGLAGLEEEVSRAAVTVEMIADDLREVAKRVETKEDK